jgi:hypothetical protein
MHLFFTEKLSSPKKIVSSPRKHPPSSPKIGGQKRAPPSKTLASYFKVSSKPQNKEEVGVLKENKGKTLKSQNKCDIFNINDADT